MFLCVERGRCELAVEFAMHVFRMSKINACASPPPLKFEQHRFFVGKKRMYHVKMSMIF